MVFQQSWGLKTSDHLTGLPGQIWVGEESIVLTYIGTTSSSSVPAQVLKSVEEALL